MAWLKLAAGALSRVEMKFMASENFEWIDKRTRHSSERWNPFCFLQLNQSARSRWIPAFAGMTSLGFIQHFMVHSMPANTVQLSSTFAAGLLSGDTHA